MVDERVVDVRPQGVATDRVGGLRAPARRIRASMRRSQNCEKFRFDGSRGRNEAQLKRSRRKKAGAASAYQPTGPIWARFRESPM